MREIPAIEPEITRARTLPGWFYADAELFEHSREALFSRSFAALPAATASVPPGAAHPVTLYPGFLDEPLLFVHDEGGERHLLANVCTHRGNIVVREPGPLTGLRCGYHGRRFSLGGRCLSMPEFEDVEGFPGPEDDLRRFTLGNLGPVPFGAIHPSSPFDEWLGPLAGRLGFLDFDQLVHDAGASRTYEFEASWALYCENYLEGFHIPFVHPELNRVLSFGDYQTELFRTGVLQIGVASPGEPCFDLPSGHPDQPKRIAAYYYWLFPGTMLNFYPWGLSLNAVEPLGPTRTRVRFESWVLDESKREGGASGALDLVEQQDEEIVMQVQRGVRSHGYDRGRYSPTQERGVHHFHRMLAEALRTTG